MLQLSARMEAWAREPSFNALGVFGSATKTKNKSLINGRRYHQRIYRRLEHWQPRRASDLQLYIEPWLRGQTTKRMLQPDAVLIDPLVNGAIVIEAKMNWKDGRDEKLVNEYLYAVQSAWGLDVTWPALITGNIAHLGREPRLGLDALLDVYEWSPGDPTPVLLVP